MLRYTDTDGASQDHHQAISGYTFLINGGTISWSSWKQEPVTLSTAEAEYITAMYTTKECIWLCQLVGELVMVSDAYFTLSIFHLCDCDYD